MLIPYFHTFDIHMKALIKIIYVDAIRSDWWTFQISSMNSSVKISHPLTRRFRNDLALMRRCLRVDSDRRVSQEAHISKAIRLGNWDPRISLGTGLYSWFPDRARFFRFGHQRPITANGEEKENCTENGSSDVKGEMAMSRNFLLEQKWECRKSKLLWFVIVVVGLSGFSVKIFCSSEKEDGRKWSTGSIYGTLDEALTAPCIC